MLMVKKHKCVGSYFTIIGNVPDETEYVEPYLCLGFTLDINATSCIEFEENLRLILSYVT